jgi:hypothetical protein
MRSLSAAGICVLALLALSACGGGSSHPGSQTIRAGGFRFQAPYGWHVRRRGTQVQASPKPVSTEVVSVTVFPLLRAYKPSLFAKASRELDGDAAQLGQRLGGYVKTKATTRVAGSPVRQYVVVAKQGKNLSNEQITFFLRGKTEFQLLCQWDASEKSVPDYCGQLTRTFRPI